MIKPEDQPAVRKILYKAKGCLAHPEKMGEIIRELAEVLGKYKEELSEQGSTPWQAAEDMIHGYVASINETPQANPDEPMRVEVWNGDKSEFLGKGKYVGDVDIYFIQMPDGSLQSNANAETPPVDVPAGGEVIGPISNPKIVLDSGRTVYGCQTWWGPTDG